MAAEHISLPLPLPHELVLDILSRLPAKSLGRFRCVSKLWSNSIVESNFIQMHLRRAIKQGHTNLVLVTNQDNAGDTCVHLLVGDSFDKAVQIENPFGVSGDFRVLGSCNGIICLCRSNGVCLLNPCTREYKVTEFQQEFTDWYYSNAYGFGYDGVSKEYILVIFHSRGSSSSSSSGYASQASVYSLNGAFLLDNFTIPYRHIMSGERMGIYLNGFLHWVATKDSSETPVIISFDIEKKMFQEMLTPPGNMHQEKHYHYKRYICLGVLQGQLSIFDHLRDGIIELWVMQNYGVSDSLVKLLSVDTKFITISSRSSVLCFSENGKLLLWDMRDLLLYDPKQEKMWKINYRGVYQNSVRNWIPHVASLVRLNSGTYADPIAGLEHSKKRKTREHYRVAGLEHSKKRITRQYGLKIGS